MQSFDVVVPIQLMRPQGFQPGKTLFVKLCVFSASGEPLSEPFVLPVTILSEESQPEGQDFISSAVHLTELGLATFDDCLEALRKCKGDIQQACDFLISYPRIE